MQGILSFNFRGCSEEAAHVILIPSFQTPYKEQILLHIYPKYYADG